MAKKNKNSNGLTLNGLTACQIISLKKLLAQVNNTASLKLTLNFVELLRNNHIISKRQATLISNRLQNTHMNANGFDIDYQGNVNNTLNSGIIAEVKCSYPINVTSYGPAQLKAITKDIECLNGSSKALKVKNIKGDIGKYYRFMVLLDDGTCQTAISTLLKLPSSVPLKIYNPNKPLDRDNIFIVPVQL